MRNYVPHPAEARVNKFGAKCSVCGGYVPAGYGLTEKIMGTTKGWRTYHEGDCAAKAASEQTKGKS